MLTVTHNFSERAWIKSNNGLGWWVFDATRKYRNHFRIRLNIFGCSGFGRMPNQNFSRIESDPFIFFFRTLDTENIYWHGKFFFFLILIVKFCHLGKKKKKEFAIYSVTYVSARVRVCVLRKSRPERVGNALESRPSRVYI